MIFRRVALVAALVAASGAMAQANLIDTNSLRKNCTGDPIARVTCLSYIGGFADGYMMGQRDQRNMCLKANYETMVDQYVAFIEDRPQWWSQPAHIALTSFFESYYPCA